MTRHRPRCLRVSLVLFALIVCAAGGCRQESIRPTVPLGEYHTSRRYGYRIRVPKGWRQSDGAVAPYDLEFLGHENRDYTPTLRISVEKQTLAPSEEMLQDFLTALAQSYDATYSEYSRVSSRNVRINGRLASQMSSRYMVGDKMYQNLETFVFLSDKRFRIVLTALARDFGALAAEAESAAATFQIIRDVPYVPPAPATGFEVQPPEGWLLLKQQVAGVAIAYVEPTPKAGFAANLTISIHKAEGKPSAAEIEASADTLKTAIKARLGAAEFIGESRPTVDGQPGLQLVNRSQGRHGDVVRHQTLVFAEDRQFVLTFSCLAADYPALSQDFAKTIAGFKILPVPSDAAKGSDSK